MNPKTASAHKMLKIAENILIDRGSMYESKEINDYAHAQIMEILFPDGSGRGFENLVRYKHISHIVDKLIRYKLNVDKEHLMDIANYAFLLAAFDNDREEANK